MHYVSVTRLQHLAKAFIDGAGLSPIKGREAKAVLGQLLQKLPAGPEPKSSPVHEASRIVPHKSDPQIKLEQGASKPEEHKQAAAQPSSRQQPPQKTERPHGHDQQPAAQKVEPISHPADTAVASGNAPLDPR